MIKEKNNNMKIRPVFTCICGIFLFLIAGEYFIFALFYDGILNNRIFDYLIGIFLTFMGIFGVRFKYLYNNEYLVVQALKQGHPIYLIDIMEISTGNLTGIYIIRTNKKIYHVQLLLQKKSIIRFAEHVKKYNENCKIDL